MYTPIVNNIRDNVAIILSDIGYDIIDEAKSPDIGSKMVRVHLERNSDETETEIINYIIITYYVDRLYTDSQRAEISKQFLAQLRRAFLFRGNDVGGIHYLSFINSFFIDVNDRIEGFKVTYGINSY